jgi:hypothetical protein
MAGSLSVGWTKPGAGKPEPIPAECLFVAADGKKAGLRLREWRDVAGIDELRKRPDYPEGFTRTSGHALALNGKDQFVELPKDVADFRQCRYTVEFKWLGGQTGARLFEFANPEGDALWLSPSEAGSLVFAIRHAGQIQQVSAPAIPSGAWMNLQVVIEGYRAAIYADGKAIAENSTMTVTSETVRANRCYLGCGLNGAYFNGLIGRFTIHSQGGRQ